MHRRKVVETRPRGRSHGTEAAMKMWVRDPSSWEAILAARKREDLNADVNKLYSFNTHFLLCHYEGGRYFVNWSRYSNHTSSHQSLLSLILSQQGKNSVHYKGSHRDIEDILTCYSQGSSPFYIRHLRVKPKAYLETYQESQEKKVSVPSGNLLRHYLTTHVNGDMNTVISYVEELSGMSIEDLVLKYSASCPDIAAIEKLDRGLGVDEPLVQAAAFFYGIREELPTAKGSRIPSGLKAFFHKAKTLGLQAACLDLTSLDNGRSLERLLDNEGA
jgi:hypothetical protein